MKRALSLVITVLMAATLFSTTASAMTISNLQPYEKEYLYQMEKNTGAIRTWTEREPQSDNTWVSKYHINFYDDLTNTPTASNGYIEINNIVKEYNGVAYSYGPVKLTFHGGTYNYFCEKTYNYLPEDSYQVRDGTYEGYNYKKFGNLLKEKEYNTFYVLDPGDYTEEPKDYEFTLDKPGFYAIGGGINSWQLQTFNSVTTISLYIAKPGENISNDLASKAVGTPGSVNVTMNTKGYTCPGYKINGDFYVKIRDIAYMFKNTSKQFNISMKPQFRLNYDDTITKTADAVSLNWINHEYGESNSYTANGTELKKLAAGNVEAKLNTVRTITDSLCTNIYPTVYSINGSNYYSLEFMLKYVNAKYSYNSDMSAVTVNTNTAFYD